MLTGNDVTPALSFLLALIVLLPAGVFAVLGVGWLLGWEPRERAVGRASTLCYGVGTVAALLLWLGMSLAGQQQVTAHLGNWFELHQHAFPLTLVVDRLSLPFVLLSVVLVGVDAVFSVRYMHREPGYLRFFVLLNLFGFGILLLFTAGSFDFLIAGWELVGLTSVLLIAYFQHRREPVQNALRVFAIYRSCDVGLLVGAVMLHHFAGTTVYAALFPNPWPAPGGPVTGVAASVVGGLLLLAAMGKAAQVPFSGWLPRAMEGPTPSSAIFYGALSVHAGAYLLLRARPILAEAPIVCAAIVVIGLLTALYGTSAGRVAADAKTSLAFASVTQLGIIFMEIGLGWTGLAVLHVCGHAAVRTLEFLRAPSMLHDFHHLHAFAGGHLGKTGAYYEALLPAPLRRWLYRLSLDRGHLDTVLERFAVTPVLRLARTFHDLETRWLARAFGPHEPPRRAVAARVERPAMERKAEGFHA